MIYVPNGWSNERVQAFEAVMSAVRDYWLYDATLTRLNVQNPTLLQIRTDLGNLILTVLGPALAAT